MNARSLGAWTVGLSVLLGAAAARAGETANVPTDERELSGKVIRSDASTLYLEHMGAVVPIELGRGTSFSGVRNASELSEGQEVRASFTVKDTENVADSISLHAPPAPAAEVSWPEDYGG